MKYITRLPRVEGVVDAMDDALSFIPLTPWMPCFGMDDVSIAYRLEEVTGGIDVGPALQMAQIRTDDPRSNQWGLSGLESSEDIYLVAADLTASAANWGKSTENMFVRFGLVYRADSADTPGAAEVWLDVAFSMQGRIAGAVAGRNIATYGGASGTNKFLPISGWVPAIAIDSLFFSAIVTGASGTIDYTLAYRVAEADRALPGSWTEIGTTQTVTTNGESSEHITANVSNLQGNMWVQFAVGFHSNSSTPQTATISAAVAVHE